MCKSFCRTKKRSAFLAAAFLLILTVSVFGIRYFRQNEDKAFRQYTHTLFCQELSGNTLSLHYTLKNPAAYGIRDVPVSLGAYTTDIGSVGASLENALALLHSYERNRLSPENQLTYDILEDYYKNALALAPYTLYEEPLAPLTGTQSQLPVILSEYQFYDISDVKTYLELLKKVPEYFQSVLDFEQARADQGLLMSADAREDLVKECNAFIRLKDDNYLYTSFEERLQKIDDTNFKDKEKANYIKQNKTHIKKYIFPAYRQLAAGLKKLEVSDTIGGLSTLPDGRRYYELTVAGETGSSRSIPKLQELTRAQIFADLGDMQIALVKSGSSNTSEENADSPTSDIFSGQGTMLEDSNPLSILTTLQAKMKNAFPAPAAADVQIKYVQESMEEYLSPAFYMIPAIDNTEENVIYINPGHLPDDLSLFTTLAHEGYPGHLYQNVYYMNRNPDPIRCLLNYGGYTEGWATYTEMISYYYTPLPKETATVMQKNASILLGIYALADMGIHYEGWTLTDTTAFFREYGITDSTAVREIYQLIIADPANYLKYYIGYLEFLQLKKEAVDAWGDEFTQKRFHKEILDAGPAPFAILGRSIF